MDSAPFQSLLLDFDGPICSVFAGFPAWRVAQELREYLQSRAPVNWMKESDDPHDILRASAELGQSVSVSAHRKLAALEMEAVKSATPTPYAADVIRGARAAGIPLAVVSNNAESAVIEYLSATGLMRYVDYVSARVSEDVSLMKPNPYLVTRAIFALNAASVISALVGDQTSDIIAAHRAGIKAIGYANKSGKREKFAEVAADLVITSMAELLLP
jgi:phosphoglycolate phosphatase-like HAD superfamily hydrolase